MHRDGTCFPRGDEKSERSLQVAGVQFVAAEAHGAAHHSRQCQDGQQDGPPVSLHRINEHIQKL